MAMRGDDTTTIMERVGHRDFGTTQIYLRQADALRGRIGTPFPQLPACLLDTNASESIKVIWSGKGSESLTMHAQIAKIKGFGDGRARPFKGH